MADNNAQPPQPDPAGNTQMFRAFANEETPSARAAPPQQKSRAGLYTGLVVLVLVVIALVVYLAV